MPFWTPPITHTHMCLGCVCQMQEILWRVCRKQRESYRTAVTINAHLFGIYGTEAEADAVYIPSSLRLTCYVPSCSIDMTTSQAIKPTQHHPLPVAVNAACLHLLLLWLFPYAFPVPFPPFKSNKQRHRQEGKRKHGKCQHTLKRLANGDNVKHERSQWSVQSGESRDCLGSPAVTMGGITPLGRGPVASATGWRTLAKWVAIKWLKVPLALDDGVGDSHCRATKNKYEHTNCRSHLFTLLWRNFQGGAAGWFRVISGNSGGHERLAGLTNGTIAT